MKHYDLINYISILKNDVALTSLLYEYEFLLNTSNSNYTYPISINGSSLVFTSIDDYNYNIFYNMAQLYDVNSDHIQNNSVVYLSDISVTVNLTLAESFYTIFYVSSIPILVLKQIYYTLKYSSIKMFFRDNYSKFLPDFDNYSIDNTQKTKLLQTAFMQEFDKFASIMEKIKSIGNIDTIPEEYINYLAQLIGFENASLELLTLDAYRYLVKNIVDVYNMKGTTYSFELFFNFLGFDTVVTEYWFDRRFYLSGYKSNPYTGESDNTKFGYYLTPYEPMNNQFSFTSEMATQEYNIKNLLDFNSLTDISNSISYGVTELLGYKKVFGSSKYTGETFEFFKTNIVNYNIISMDTQYISTGITSINQINAILSYIEMLTPINIYKLITFSTPPGIDDVSKTIFLADDNTEILNRTFLNLNQITNDANGYYYYINNIPYATLDIVNSPMSITNNNSTIWIMAGSNGYYSKSTNTGATWSNFTTIKNWGVNTINSIANNGTNWIVGGSNGYFSVSTDNGVTWSDAAPMNGWFNNNILKIGVNGTSNVWIAVGTNGFYSISSNNGTTWSNAALMDGWSNTYIKTIYAYSANHFVVGGQNGSYSYSSDNGTSWSTKTVMTGWNTNTINSIVSSGTTKFLAVGTNQKYSISTTGVSGFGSAQTMAGLIGNLISITYNSSITTWVVVGENGYTTTSSNNGSTWTNDSLIPGWISRIVTGVTFSQAATKLIVVNTSGFYAISNDNGTIWPNNSQVQTTKWAGAPIFDIVNRKYNIANIKSIQYTDIENYESKFIVDYPNSYDNKWSSKSTDNGVSWTPPSQTMFGWLANAVLAVAMDGGANPWLIVGQNGCYNISADGITWGSVLNIFGWGSNSINDIGYDGIGHVIVGGSNGQYCVSSDYGSTWGTVYKYVLNTSTSTQAWSSTVIGSTVIITGNVMAATSAVTIATNGVGISIVVVRTVVGDGSNVPTQTLTVSNNIVSGTSITIDGIDIPVSIGDTSIIVANKIAKALSVNSVYAVTYGSSSTTWIAAGANGYFSKSVNRTTWSTAIKIAGWGANNINAVATDGSGKWMAVGTNGLFSVSIDNAVNWTTASVMDSWCLSHNEDINDVAYGGGKWVAVGSNGSVSNSINNGLTWSSCKEITGWGLNAISSIVYSSFGSNWIAAGAFGRVSNSSDGITWTSINPARGNPAVAAIGNWYSIYINSIAIDTSGHVVIVGNSLYDAGMDQTFLAQQFSSDNLAYDTGNDLSYSKAILKLNNKNLGNLIISNFSNLYSQYSLPPLVVQYITINDGTAHSLITLKNPFNGSEQINQLVGKKIQLKNLSDLTKNGIYTILNVSLSSAPVYANLYVQVATLSGTDQSTVGGLAYLDTENTTLGRVVLDTISDRVINYVVNRNSFTWGTSSQILSTYAINAIATDGVSTWIVAGNNGYFNRSNNNGVTWSGFTQISGWSTNSIRAIATDNNGIWFVAGDNGTVSSSTDNGISWSNAAIPLGFVANAVRGIATNGNKKWIFVGDNGKMNVTLNNGANWGTVFTVSGWTTNGIYTISNNKSVWIIGGAAGLSSISNNNGLTWTTAAQISGFGSNIIQSIVNDNKTTWMAGGVGGYCCFSINNGLTWSTPTSGVLSSTNAIYSVATDFNGEWIVGGASGYWNKVNTITVAIHSGGGGTGYVAGDVGKVVKILSGSKTALLLINTVAIGAVTSVTLLNSGLNYTAATSVATKGDTTGSGLIVDITAVLSSGTAAQTIIGTNQINVIASNINSKWIVGGASGYCNKTL